MNPELAMAPSCGKGTSGCARPASVARSRLRWSVLHFVLADSYTRINLAIDGVTYLLNFSLPYPALDNAAPAQQHASWEDQISGNATWRLGVGASGFVSREFPAEFAIWRLPPGADEPTLVASQPGPFQPQAIDAALRGG